MDANRVPSAVSTGIAEFRSAYRQMSSRSGTPRERATVMYGEENAPTISRRTMREIRAICRTATVTVGSTRLDQVVNPAAGKIGIRTANTVMSISPVQKSGMDWPAIVTTLAPSSRLVSARRAIHTPSGMATSVVSTIAATDRVIVYGSRARTTSKAGAWNEYEVPRSRWRRPRRYSRYWVNTDWSRPMSALIRARSSVLASG